MIEAINKVLEIAETTGKHDNTKTLINTLLEHTRPLHILVVEDHEINQKLMMRILDKMGYQADLAKNGAEAVIAIEQTSYDLIFMDIQMPVMNGYEATQTILTTLPPEKRPIIVALTANVQTEVREKCFQLGMSDFISKPIRLEEIKRVIEQWGKGSVSNELILDPNTLESLKELDCGDGFFKQMVEGFYQSLTDLSKEALQLYELDQPDALSTIIHQFKGVSSNMGALETGNFLLSHHASYEIE